MIVVTMNEPTHSRWLIGNDLPQVYLLFANRSEEDILLRNELDELQKTDSRIHIFYTVDHTNNIFWKGGRGFITKQMASNFLPPPSDNTLVRLIF